MWYKDDELITNNNIDPSVLIFSELNLNDRGFYRCQAKNTIDQVLQFVNSPEVVVNITSKSTVTMLYHYYNILIRHYSI